MTYKQFNEYQKAMKCNIVFAIVNDKGDDYRVFSADSLKTSRDNKKITFELVEEVYERDLIEPDGSCSGKFWSKMVFKNTAGKYFVNTVFKTEELLKGGKRGR